LELSQPGRRGASPSSAAICCSGLVLAGVGGGEATAGSGPRRVRAISAMNSASTALAGAGGGAVGMAPCPAVACAGVAGSGVRVAGGAGSAARGSGSRDHETISTKPWSGLDAVDRLGGDLELVLVAGAGDGVDQRAVGAGQDAPHVREGLAIHGATAGCAVSIL
jgi:hypothetical protein